MELALEIKALMLFFKAFKFFTKRQYYWSIEIALDQATQVELQDFLKKHKSYGRMGACEVGTRLWLTSLSPYLDILVGDKDWEYKEFPCFF